jgi:ubiquinone/menaquinone biosynthesis C-methylase UbiE
MNSPVFGQLSQWRDTAQISAETARELDARLELRARAEDEAAAREEYLRLLGVAPGERVLDIGCGSGVVTRAIARRVVPGGRAVGVDSSPALLAFARQHAEEAGLADAIELHQGDCRKLPFGDGAFDASIAATVFAHVPGVEEAISEMIRVTRPGGRVGVFDFDGDGFLISHPDREMTRRVVAAVCDHGAVNGRLVRELPGLFADRGIAEVQARAFMPLERAAGSFYADLAERAGRTAAKVGAITEAESAAWIQSLREVIQGNRFLGGRLHVFVWGTRRR